MKLSPGDRVIFPNDLCDPYLNNNPVNIIRNSVGVILTMEEYVATLRETLGAGRNDIIEDARKNIERHHQYPVRLLKVASKSESKMPLTWDFECVEGSVHVVSENQIRVIED